MARVRVWTLLSIILLIGISIITIAISPMIKPFMSSQFQTIQIFIFSLLAIAISVAGVIAARNITIVSLPKITALTGATAFSLFLYVSLGVLLFSGFMDLWRWFAFDGWYVPSWAISGMCFGMVAVLGCMLWLKRNNRLTL